MKVRYKLFLAIIVTAFVSVFALQLAQRFSFESGLERYSQSSRLQRLDPLVLGLSDIYERDQNWNTLKGAQRLPISDILIRSDQNLGAFRHRGRRFDGSSSFVRPPRLFSGLALLDHNKKYIAGDQNASIGVTKSISSDDKIVGYLAVPSSSRGTRRLDKRFSEQQQVGRIWAAVAILIGALLSAWLISRSLGRPIKNLVEQVQKLSDGHYNVNFVSDKNDEFGSLSNNLNGLANTLRDNRINRQQWISDISHELRTPVAVLQAEIECIEDGFKPLDQEALFSLKSEVSRLSYLISDLHQLSQADSGVMSFDFLLCDLATEIQSVVDGVEERFTEKKISINIELDDLPLVFGDVFRIRQVITNLIENTLRYTDSSGKFKVSWQQLDNAVEFLFEDSAPSVPEESLPKLFNRLYRVDPSRNRATGASGLGLSICHAIIKAHGGVISAEKSSLGGLAIRFTLPTVS